MKEFLGKCVVGEKHVLCAALLCFLFLLVWSSCGVVLCMCVCFNCVVFPNAKV